MRKTRRGRRRHCRLRSRYPHADGAVSSPLLGYGGGGEGRCQGMTLCAEARVCDPGLGCEEARGGGPVEGGVCQEN